MLRFYLWLTCFSKTKSVSAMFHTLFGQISWPSELCRRRLKGLTATITAVCGVTEWLSSGKLGSVCLWVLPREEHDTGFPVLPFKHCMARMRLVVTPWYCATSTQAGKISFWLLHLGVRSLWLLLLSWKLIWVSSSIWTSQKTFIFKPSPPPHSTWKGGLVIQE